MKQLITLILFTSIQLVLAQQTAYQYQKELTGISEEWHSIYLTEDMYSKLNNTKTDIRILANGTTEIPYFLERISDKKETKKLTFDLLNQTSKGKLNYYTLHPNTDEAINSIHFDFDQKNYDFLLRLEASMDQKEWFVVRESRVLGIHNEHIDYAFNKVYFPLAKYTYYRVSIPKKVKIDHVYLYQEILEKAKKNIYAHQKKVTQEDKNTLVFLTLPNSVPVSQIGFDIDTKKNYYRSISIAYLSDSTKTPKGWRKNYQQVFSGVLSSLEKSLFHFSEVTTKELKVTIRNRDNQPLSIGKSTVMGLKYRLIAQFPMNSTQNQYSLVYGNNQAQRPNYDIKFFKNTIPEKPSPLITGSEVLISQGENKTQSSFLDKEKLLWVLLVIIVLLLAKFTFSMLQKPLPFILNL